MKHIFSRAIFVMATLLTTLATWAQDIIITTDAQKIEAKILEVSKSEIRYKEKDNLDGPTFVLGTDEINSIIYSNGKVVLYNQQTTSTKVEEKQKELTPEKEQALKEDLAWIEEQNRLERQNAAQRYYEQEQAIKRQQEQEQMQRSQEQFRQSLDELGSSIKRLDQTINSYVLEVHNTTQYPFRINLDGHILGIIGGYKTERVLVPLEWYGRLQVVQTKGYMITPLVKDYKIPLQKKKAVVSIKI